MVYKKRHVKDSYIGVDILDKIVGYIEDRKDEFVDEDGDVDENTLDDIINEEMDNTFIYDDDMWEVMAHYQRPNEADWNDAYMQALDDVSSAVRDDLDL